jgi:hypothetical protein
MLCNIATNLVNKSYGDGGSSTGDSDGSTGDSSNGNKDADQDQLVCAAFHADMKQVIINCITYNTEVTVLVAQSYKIAFALHRYMDRWVWSANRPVPATAIDDRTCMLTGHSLVAEQHEKGHYAAATALSNGALKCGKCTGLFSIDAIFQSKNPFVVRILYRLIIILSETLVQLRILSQI